MRDMNIPESKLNVCKETEYKPHYQRELELSWLKRTFTQGISKILFRRLLVGKRSDGSYWVVDGSQRLELARRSGWTSIPCQVFDSTGFEMEAKIFALQDDRSSLDGAERFHAQVMAKDPRALEILGICTSMGFQLNYQKSTLGGLRAANLCCLGTVIRVYEMGFLPDSLKLMIDGWQSSKDSVRNEMLMGVALFLRTYSQVSKESLIKKMSTARFSAASIYATSVGLTPVFGGTGSAKYEAVVQALVEMHNYRNKKNTLPHYAVMKSSSKQT